MADSTNKLSSVIKEYFDSFTPKIVTGLILVLIALLLFNLDNEVYSKQTTGGNVIGIIIAFFVLNAMIDPLVQSWWKRKRGTNSNENSRNQETKSQITKESS